MGVDILGVLHGRALGSKCGCWDGRSWREWAEAGARCQLRTARSFSPAGPLEMACTTHIRLRIVHAQHGSRCNTSTAHLHRLLGHTRARLPEREARSLFVFTLHARTQLAQACLAVYTVSQINLTWFSARELLGQLSVRRSLGNFVLYARHAPLQPTLLAPNAHMTTRIRGHPMLVCCHRSMARTSAAAFTSPRRPTAGGTPPHRTACSTIAGSCGARQGHTRTLLRCGRSATALLARAMPA